MTGGLDWRGQDIKQNSEQQNNSIKGFTFHPFLSFLCKTAVKLLPLCSLAATLSLLLHSDLVAPIHEWATVYAITQRFCMQVGWWGKTNQKTFFLLTRKLQVHKQFMHIFSIEDVFNYNNYQYILLTLGYKYLLGLINCACVQKEVIVRYLI